LLSLTRISLRRGRRLLFSDASFQIYPGQRLGLIGANGSGKSSLFALLLGELEADDGELSIDANDVIAHVSQQSPDSTASALDYVMDGDAELRETQSAIASIEADTDSAKGTVASELSALYEQLEAIDGFTAEPRAAKLLNGLGFSDSEASQPVRSFSGGWRMRLNLARALMCRSDILLLDEPTNHLDLPAILWLERWLKSYGGVLLVVSHDRDFLDGICTRIAHIEHGSIRTYTGNYSQFEAMRAEQLAQQQAMHSRQQKEIKHIQGFVDRFRYKASKARQAQSRLKMLERMTLIAPAHVDSPFKFHFEKPKKQPQHLLGISDGVLGYRGEVENTVLENVSINLMAGDRIGLLGVNGAGKSTLVKALESGNTLLQGERVVSKDTRIGYFAQHQLELLDPERSPVDHLRDFAPDDREADLRQYLGRFNFGGERIFEPVAPFSGGEKARLVLAMMIRQSPNLLLLDEPTNHLDLDMRQALSLALVEYSGALVVISHDRHLLRSVCDELLIVNDGAVDRFTRSLDDYPQWLIEQERTSADSPVAVRKTEKFGNRKQRRQAEAEQRRKQKPLADKVKKIDKELSLARHELETIEATLGDQALYSEPGRLSELEALTKRQAEVKASIDNLEWEWLEAEDALANEIR